MQHRYKLIASAVKPGQCIRKRRTLRLAACRKDCCWAGLSSCEGVPPWHWSPSGGCQPSPEALAATATAAAAHAAPLAFAGSQAAMQVVVVGGGIIGAATAHYLAAKGARPLVLEACSPACSASGKAGRWPAGCAGRSSALHAKAACGACTCYSSLQHVVQLRCLPLSPSLPSPRRLPCPGLVRWPGGGPAGPPLVPAAC